MRCPDVPMEDRQDGIDYRYWLHRDVSGDGDRKGLVFVMLNPSTADAVQDDPTIRRCIGYARTWGYRDLTVVNLFAMRATAPASMKAAGPAAVGLYTPKILRWARTAAKLLVVAWGNHGTHRQRSRIVLAQWRPTSVMALGLTKSLQPLHPLRLSRELVPQELRIDRHGLVICDPWMDWL